MDTLQSRKSVRREEHFQLFPVLSIGHKRLPGFQRVISHPFPAKRYKQSNHQDLVFVSPPDAGKDFRWSNNTVWDCWILLLFTFYASTDSGIKLHDCAFVLVLREYDKDPLEIALSHLNLFGEMKKFGKIPIFFSQISKISIAFSQMMQSRFFSSRR